MGRACNLAPADTHQMGQQPRKMANLERPYKWNETVARLASDTTPERTTACHKRHVKWRSTQYAVGVYVHLWAVSHALYASVQDARMQQTSTIFELLYAWHRLEIRHKLLNIRLQRVRRACGQSAVAIGFESSARDLTAGLLASQLLGLDR